ncbi:hypothetical protein quinque_012693 [Culex quinquefasciatus]
MASTSSNNRSSTDVPSDYARLKLLWLNFLNSDDDNAGNAASKTSWLELFLYEFGKLNAEQTAQFQRSNISENVSSALSRQLLQFIIEICSRGESTTTDGGETDLGDLEQQQQQQEESSSSLSSTSTYTTARSVITTTADRSDNRQGQEDSNEDRYQELRVFLLEGIGGRILRALEQLGGKDIANGREIAEVLIRILPTRKWCTPQLADLQYQPQYNAQLLKVFEMRTCNSDWRNETSRASLHTTICGMQTLLAPPESSPEPQPTSLTDYQTEAFNAHLRTALTQDQLTLTVLNLLESLVVNENLLTIDDRSATISCLRMAIERLRRLELIEESPRNKLILRHKLLGILMISLNNLFFLDNLESDFIGLKQVAAQVMQLLHGELEGASTNPISCDFIYNLTYTIVSTVNQSFLHYNETLVSEQFFLAIFRLLESNLDIIKHVYGLLQASSSGSQPKLVDILLKMLQNFITTLSPNRVAVPNSKKPRARHRIHHSRQDPRTAYVCALENILLNIFPIVKHTDQRTLLQFFTMHQICCCNATIQTLEVLLRFNRDHDLVPRVCLNFANRNVIHAIFSRSNCDSCEAERFNDRFYDRFAQIHRDVFDAYGRLENRPRMPTLLRYLQDGVRVVPYRLGRFVLFELVLPQLCKEKADFKELVLDETTKEITNSCLMIVARCLRDANLFEAFFSDENRAMIRELSLRAEFVYQAGVVLRIGVENAHQLPNIEGPLGTILLDGLEDLSNYLGLLFGILRTSDVNIDLHSIPPKDQDIWYKIDSTANVLQVYVEHWKIVRHLLQVNERFYAAFLQRFTHVECFFPLVYDLFSLLIHHDQAKRSVPLPKLADLTADLVDPERRSILNIFHYNDQIFDHQLPSAEEFFKSTSDHSGSVEDKDYSFLRELALKYPDVTAHETADGNGRLEKSWSLLEMFNIKHLLADLVDEYFPGTAIRRARIRRGDLPDQVQQLLSTGGFIRKRLATLVELILSTFQMLVDKNDQLGDAMQSALVELKKLLLSGAFENWESPESSRNVMNALQSLLKIAEVRSESAGFEVVDQAEQNEYYFPVQCFSLGSRKKSLSAEDDLSSTDESYTTALDDGYEGDVENDHLVPRGRKGSGVGREQSLRINRNICAIVVEILIELSKKCANNPASWSSLLSQTVLKLNGIKEYLGGSLYLITGFSPILEKSDVELKELQTAVLELITDLDSPEVLSKFLQLLSLEDPPVQLILTKLTNLIDANYKLECYTELNFPDANDDGSRISTCDVLLSKKINYLREHHRFFNIRTPFTCAARVIPLNCADFSPWNNEGFTASVWFRLSTDQQDSNRVTMTHLISVGSEKQIVSVFINRQRQFTVRFNKPDRIITSAHTKQYLANAAGLTCCDDCSKELSHLWNYKNFLRSMEPITQPFRVDSPGAQCVYCYKLLPAGRDVATTSLSNDYFYDLHSEQYTIKDLQLMENRWTMLALSVCQLDNTITIELTLDGVQQQSLSVGDACMIHIDTSLPVIAIGHRTGTEDDCPLNYSLSNVQLFRRCWTDLTMLANLYALGPNWIHLAGALSGEIIPNYGSLNLSKLTLEDLQPKNTFQLLQQTHVGYYAAHKPDLFIAIKPDYGKIVLGMLNFSPRLEPVENLSLQRSIQLSGGISAILFAFARIVELSSSARVHASSLSLLLRIAHDNHDFYNEFVQRDLLELVGIVLKNKKCHKEICVLAALLEVAFDQPIFVKRVDTYCVATNSMARVRYPEIIIFFFENFQMWIDRSEEVLNLVFDVLITCTREKHPGMDFNCKRLATAGLVPTLIDFCRMNFVIPPKTVKISKSAADSLVTLITILSNTPPNVSLLKEIIELLLLMHKPTDSYVTHDRQKFYFNINPQLPSRPSSKTSEQRTTPRLNLRERRLRYSQLRKAIPLALSNSHETSFESTTSFIELSRLGSSSKTPPDSGESSTPSTPQRSAATLDNSANYERLNQAMGNMDIRRRSLKADKHKIRRLQSPGSRGCSTPRERVSSPRICERKELQRSTQSLPTKFKFFEQNYFGTGNDFIQESFLRALCDFLLILPDQDAKQFFHVDNQIIETLLILANNSNIRIRTMVINLIAVISDRVLHGSSTGVLSYTDEQYKICWHHLGNQISSHSVNVDLLNASFRWITKSGSVLTLETLILDHHFTVVQESGLNILLAILPQSSAESRLFQLILKVMDYVCVKQPRAAQYMLENGLIWTIVKTAVKMHEKDDDELASNFDSYLDFVTGLAHRAVVSVNFVNPFWDLINGLTLAERNKNPKVTCGVRNVHALLYRNLLQFFVYRPTESIIGHKNNSFTVDLPGSSIPRSEVRIRFNQVHDKAVQFITNSDAHHTVSDAEILLIKTLMSRTLNGNPRGGNIIIWCLLPKRPLTLKLYTLRQLGQYIDGGSKLSMVCDVTMLKVFSESIVLVNQKELSEDDRVFVQSFCQAIEGPQTGAWTLTQTIDKFDYLRTVHLNDQEQSILKSINKQEKLIHTCTIAAMEITRNIVEKQNKLRKELIIQLKKDSDFKFFNQWRQIIDQMTHEDAPWYNAKLYPNSWELDDTFGPGMVQTRMRRCHQTIEQRFLQKDFQFGDGTVPQQLLDYLMPKNRSQEFSMENQLLYTSIVKQISPKQELDSECILTSTELVLSPNTGDLEIYDLCSISKIWTKRYQHQETAVEIFLRSGRSLFLVFDRMLEREVFAGFFQDLVQREGRQELEAQTQLWKEGFLSNWEYLMHLNQISGRSYHDLMQYPVFPWILADYESSMLDLLLERSFRNLEKPIAVQFKDLEKHYINNYNYLKQSENDSTANRKIHPYHYSSHYSNSGTVLHFLVRMLPFTSLFLQYQDNSFDIPDRTFHSLGTTWKLASRDSPTDVKELIPEFYSCPEFLENLEGFDFGNRQSGEPVNHVELPQWSHQSARLFVLIHRQALESDHVRRRICHWIDLTFGYKQVGPAAVEAINVFHPATYASFNASDIDDPVEKLALETMIKTYGQMPRQLFDSPHPQPNLIAPLGANPPEVIDSVTGLKWGLYSGTPVLPNPKIVDIKTVVGSLATLVQLDGNRIVGIPERTNIFRGPQSRGYYFIDWGKVDNVVRFRSIHESDARSSELVYNTNVDPITACGSDPNCADIWFGHRSGRIAVFQQKQVRKVSFFNHNIQPAVTRTRSSSFRKWIGRKSANWRKRLEGDDDGEETVGPVPVKWNFPVVLIKHRAEITAIAISTEFKIVVSVSMDGTAAIWDYNTLSYVREIPKPVNVINSKISLVCISPTLGDIVTVHSSQESSRRSVSRPSNETSTLVDDESFEVTENYNLDYVNITMASSRDQLRLHTVNAKYVEHTFMESPVVAVSYSAVKEGCGVNCIAVGLESGVIRLFSSWNLALVREITMNPYDAFGIKSLIFSKHQHLVVLTTSNVIQTWKSEGLPGMSPQIAELPVRRSFG